MAAGFMNAISSIIAGASRSGRNDLANVKNRLSPNSTCKAPVQTCDSVAEASKLTINRPHSSAVPTGPTVSSFPSAVLAENPGMTSSVFGFGASGAGDGSEVTLSALLQWGYNGQAWVGVRFRDR
eukprot:1180780-Prorocentrum_minimum.AAC.3